MKCQINESANCFTTEEAQVATGEIKPFIIPAGEYLRITFKWDYPFEGGMVCTDCDKKLTKNHKSVYGKKMYRTSKI